MIHPLRQRHRWMVGALGVLLPIAFIAGIAARKPVPSGDTVPSELVGNAQDFGPVLSTDPNLWPGHRIITMWHRNAAGAVAVELMFRDLVKPDVLVYWVRGAETARGSLPDNARLLGPLSSRGPLGLPPAVLGESGRLFLYSLADHEIAAISRAFIAGKD